MSAVVVLLSCFVICLAEEWAYSKIKKERLSVPQLIRLWLLTFSVSYLRTLFSDINRLLLAFDGVGLKECLFDVTGALLTSVIVLAAYRLLHRCNAYADTEDKEAKPLRIIKAVCFVLCAVTSCVLMGSLFIRAQWSGVEFEQMLVNLVSPTTGTEFSIYLKGFQYVLAAFALSYLFGFVTFSRFRLKTNEKFTFRLPVQEIAFAAAFLAVTGCFGYVVGDMVEKELKVSEGLNTLFVSSDFIEKNYTDPRKTEITFPKQKRNLIFFYLESVENSYLSKELGGYGEVNLMPELTALAEEGIVFSDNETKFGGPQPITGTTWSLASMVNQTAGIPLKFPGSMTAYSTPDSYLKNAVALGDILHANGYEQEVMIGANAAFGGLDNMYLTHGNYKIFDYRYAQDNGYIPKDYFVWWGYEDDKLYEFAKKEITRLSKTGKPFNFTMENADTHMPNGYLAPDKPRPYKSPYANAIAYSTSQVTEFVRWIMEQPFYENTTVILIGDHLSMDKAFFQDFSPSYHRTQFNLILNSAASADGARYVNRLYSNMDMYPTTLAAMGCTVSGNRLGLGTNLFSDEETLLERYGTDYVSHELTKKSDFYNRQLAGS